MPLVEHIRDAGPDDVRALCDLQLRAAWDEDLPHLSAHPDAVEVPPDAVADGRVRVAVGGGTRLGYAVVLPVRDGACELDDLFVERAFMHRGIGRLLVDDALRWARERGATCMEVTAHPRALGFYEKVGFRVGNPVATRFDSGLRMRLELPH